MIKTRTWIIVIAAVAIVLAVLTLRQFSEKKSGTTAVITQHGEALREIDLSRVTEEYRFTVETEDGGVNEILVQPGRICVSEANCPDRICVMQGWLSEGAMPIICMPHELVIEIKDAQSASGTDAATR